MGNWGVENPGELPAGFLKPTSLVNQFDDINTHGAFDGGFTAKASDIGKWAAGEYGFNFVTTVGNVYGYHTTSSFIAHLTVTDNNPAVDFDSSANLDEFCFIVKAFW